MSMTTELAQRMKAAALNATGAYERLSVMPDGDIFDISLAEGTQLDADITALNSFRDEATPAKVLELVEALEAKEQQRANWFQMAQKLGEDLDTAEKRISELESRTVKPVAWMRNANVTSFMSRFTTNENYAVEQWGDDAVALYSLPVDFIPACFTDERNLMHINERGRETSLIWSVQNSDSGDIKLFRIAAAAGKGE